MRSGRDWIRQKGLHADGYTYESAFAHVSKYQKNRRSLKIGSSEKLTVDEHNGWATIECSYGRGDYLRFHKGGDLTVFRTSKVIEMFYTYVEGYGTFNRNAATPRLGLIHPRDGDSKIREYSVLAVNTGLTGPPLPQKCKTCGGYEWQGDEAEELIVGMLLGLQPSNKASWWLYVKNPNYEVARPHLNRCTRCEGTGIADYGSRNLYFIHPTGHDLRLSNNLEEMTCADYCNETYQWARRSQQRDCAAPSEKGVEIASGSKWQWISTGGSLCRKMK